MSNVCVYMQSGLSPSLPQLGHTHFTEYVGGEGGVRCDGTFSFSFISSFFQLKRCTSQTHLKFEFLALAILERYCTLLVSKAWTHTRVPRTAMILILINRIQQNNENNTYSNNKHSHTQIKHGEYQDEASFNRGNGPPHGNVIGCHSDRSGNKSFCCCVWVLYGLHRVEGEE